MVLGVGELRGSRFIYQLVRMLQPWAVKEHSEISPVEILNAIIKIKQLWGVTYQTEIGQ